MSLTTLPPRTHPLLGGLAVLGGVLDELAEANLWSLSDDETLAARAALGRLGGQLTSLTLRATREVETRGAAQPPGAPSVPACLINALRLPTAEAAREVRLAGALDRDLPATATALAAG